MMLRFLSLVSFFLLVAQPVFALDRNYCESQDHVRSAFPLLKRLTSPQTVQAAATRRVNLMIADDPSQQEHKDAWVEKLKGKMLSTPYKAGLLNIICKHISPDEFHLLETGDMTPEQKAGLDGKMALMQPDIDRLLAEVATSGD